MKNSVSYKDLFEIITDFRKENNDRFDKIERIFDKHVEWSQKLTEKYTTDYEKRIGTLEKFADRMLFFIFIISGVIAAVWQLGIGWIRKQLNI